MTDRSGRSGAGETSVLEPQGPAAEIIATVWQILLWGAVVTFVITMLWLALALLRRHGGTLREPFVVVWGLVLPGLVLLGLMGVLLWSGEQVYDPPGNPDLTVDVVGHQFWWEIRYNAGEEDEVITANELHIPTGQPIELRLHASDVIHSFWVPELHGKMDMVPGRVNEHWLEAEEAGVYRGFCAEYCGIAHAQMLKIVVAQEPAAFDAWLDEQRAEAPEPDTELTAQGEQVFEDAACIDCHAIRGVGGPEPGDLTEGEFGVGPDLTNLASRQTLGAGIMRNNRGELSGWILDPQSNKPGVSMPPTDLDGEQLEALLAYLESLE
ncbi:cytochrome c oxidase subunit II [Egibacter rhizosphaerae]|uniref:Cytochrome aa3 subunit 2 n=1 Tax=Egibacter rhizosphaerae TaxID=1670831 RepID=A0A411YB00_9ACTN|nr:cytochrome c oxidase subunit II [Egibacter rhizosphaerae]QBI18384.1 cytochrome c oxidase subunit II [Egibacter rhizosphaerae]